MHEESVTYIDKNVSAINSSHSSLRDSGEMFFVCQYQPCLMEYFSLKSCIMNSLNYNLSKETPSYMQQLHN